MVNERELKRRVLLRLLGHPVVLAPMLIGLSASTMVWVLSAKPGLGWFAALAGLLLSAGAYVTRALLDEGQTARAVLAEMEQQRQAAWQSVLDDLDQRLVKSDDDPRPERALRDLRALLQAFEGAADQAPPEQLPALIDVRSQVRQLFDSSVHSLEQTIKLYDTARRIQLVEARTPLLQQRENIIKDIQGGIKQLGDTLAALQRLALAGPGGQDLTRLRAELDDSLQVAGRVEARLSALLAPDPAPLREASSRPLTDPSMKGD
jgi:hypothetical protein